MKRSLRFLHTNDFHGPISDDKFARLAELREEADLYFDSGDAVKIGNLGLAFRPERIWPQLASLRCSASVTGNRDVHLYEFAMRMKLQGATHPIFCGNLARKTGAEILPFGTTLEVNDYRIAIVTAMVPMVTPRMATQRACTLTWSDPITSLRRQIEAIKEPHDLIIALTHVGYKMDQKIAAALPEIQIIFGGHSHTLLMSPEKVNRTWIVQGGSHGRYAGSYVWADQALTGCPVPLP